MRFGRYRIVALAAEREERASHTAIERLIARFPRSTGLLPAFSPPQGA
jgi:hypothetical protein